MDYQDPTEQYHEITVPPKRTIWQKLGAGSLTISIIFHAILIVIGLIIV